MYMYMITDLDDGNTSLFEYSMRQISGTDTASNVAKLKIQHHTIHILLHIIRKRY
jgi:hypothetical protein